MDLATLIAANYNFKTRTLDLNNAVKGSDMVKVLESIRETAFYSLMEHLILRGNKFGNKFNSDSPQLPELPPKLKTLDLSENQLCGPCFPWKQLPPNLENLYIQNNELKGSIDWKSLPKGLRTLLIYGNEFDGRIAWQELPVGLNTLGVSDQLAIMSKQSMPHF